MKLIILHYHLRPGGIRRIIETATPHLIRQGRGELNEVWLATGEPPPPDWEKDFRSSLGPARMRVFVESSFGYLTGQTASVSTLRRRIRSALKQLLSNEDIAWVWAHNLGIARNPLLAEGLFRACGDRDIRLVAHHHDWWFDNRWARWRDLQHCGFRSPDSIARLMFPRSGRIGHAAINEPDATILKRHVRNRAAWIPNLVERQPRPPARKTRAAREWLRQKLGTDAPAWLLPCRLLRRKNLAEALLLTRLLRPEAWMVTTAGPSSDAEMDYSRRLETAARHQGWRLRLGILDGNGPGRPSVADLLAASEAVLLTSIQEGFGLPYLEASASGRPLVARMIPGIEPDLKKFGFRFPQGYRELMVPTGSIDWRREVTRQCGLFRSWKNGLPPVYRKHAAEPGWLSDADSVAVPFSRLTLTAQLEFLGRPLDETREVCERLNPFLKPWRELALRGHLRLASWPAKATRVLGGPAYARSLISLAGRLKSSGRASVDAPDIQNDFVRNKLCSDNLFPLLWATRT